MRVVSERGLHARSDVRVQDMFGRGAPQRRLIEDTFRQISFFYHRIATQNAL